LTDFAGAILELCAFDAYGNAVGFDPSVALTEFLYSGEQFDSKIGQQYLRQRYYNPATGRFNRLDPFFGNLNDPQSLHKYLYTHADPVNGIDPSGLFLGMSLGGFISASLHVSIGVSIIAAKTLIVGLINTAVVSAFVSGATELRNHTYKLAQFGKGGYDATTILSALRDDVIAKWSLLTPSERTNLIREIYKNGLISWDIQEMTFSWKNEWTKNNVGESAKETLTYRGYVYPVSEVNYLLWGLINRLAYESKSNMILSLSCCIFCRLWLSCFRWWYNDNATMVRRIWIGNWRGTNS
jgi:RHS repeat-associated protein